MAAINSRATAVTSPATSVTSPATAVTSPATNVASPASSSSAAAPFAGPLDALPSTTAAYSLRRLLSAYAGKAVNLHRTSDSTNADVGFTAAGDFDAAAYTAFAGVANANGASVAKWYDQSGNGLDSVQATVVSQPTIALSAANGRAVVSYASQWLATTFSGTSQPLTLAVVAIHTHGSGEEEITGDATSFSFGYAAAAGSINWFAGGTVNGIVAGVSDAVYHAILAYANGTASYVIVDRSQTANQNPGTNALTTTFGVGNNGSSASRTLTNGSIAEFILFSTTTAPQQAAIAASQQSYFGTP